MKHVIKHLEKGLHPNELQHAADMEQTLHNQEYFHHKLPEAKPIMDLKTQQTVSDELDIIN